MGATQLFCGKTAESCDFPPYRTRLRLLLKGGAPELSAHRGLSTDLLRCRIFTYSGNPKSVIPAEAGIHGWIVGIYRAPNETWANVRATHPTQGSQPTASGGAPAQE